MKTFILALVLFAFFAGEAKAFSAVRIVSLENQTRTSPLVIDNKLSYIAQRRVEDMVVKGFSHNLEGKRAWDYMRLYKYSWLTAGENLAMGFNSDTKLVNAWFKSPTHKINIVNPLFTKTGIGISGKYVVQLFAQ